MSAAVVAAVSTMAQQPVHASNTLSLNTLVSLVVGSVVVFAICAATLRPVREPHRVLIFRWARLHRVAGPGYAFVLPCIDRLETELDVTERQTTLIVADGRTADGKKLSPQIVVTWRLDPPTRRRLPRAVRAMLLESDDQWTRLVEEAVTNAARSVFGKYTRADLSHADARESAMLTTTYLANDVLGRLGLKVERALWRSSAR